MTNTSPTNDRASGKRGAPANRKDRMREEAIEKILDAAEQLFAEFGYHGVTLKDVAKKVGVSPTLLHYHFDGKDSIYEALWERKAPISVRTRLAAMRDYAREAGDNVTVEGALRVWIDTDLDAQIQDEEYWSAFGRIAAHANSAGGWGAEKMSIYFNPVILALIDVLKRAMPDTDEEVIFWGCHFASGAVTNNLARTGRLDELSNGLCSSNDFRSVKKYMATFMAAGFEAICQRAGNDSDALARGHARDGDEVSKIDVDASKLTREKAGQQSPGRHRYAYRRR